MNRKNPLRGGAPPYWPWVQILRAYVDASHAYPTPSAIGDSSPARFRTFDAIRQFFHQATQQVPITLILDNLHWADAPSLALLEFLSQELLRSRLLIVGTYRDADAARKTPLRCQFVRIGDQDDLSADRW